MVLLNVFPLIILYDFWICMCVWVHVWCMQTCVFRHSFPCTQMEARRELGWMCCLFYQSPPYSFKTGSLTKPGTSWQSSNSYDPPISALDSTEVIVICMVTAGFLCVRWGFKLWFSCLCSKNSLAPNHLSSHTYFFLIRPVSLTNHHVHEPFTQTI